MSQGFTRGTPIDTDPTLSLDSDLVVPSQKAIKDYVDTGLSTKQDLLTDTKSVKIVSNNVELDGDNATPGNNKVYGTDGSGVKGWKADPTGITGLGKAGFIQTGATQTLVEGTSGTDFNIVSSSNTQTFNIPSASALNRGLLLAADWTIFNNKAPLASPAFTGSPTAPTQLTTDNSTKIATTAYVTAAVAVPTAGSNLYLFYNY